ncbi:MAG: TonB-dependent receptor plug domain-containing protein, partial [Bacteroidales bacterium]|nr:TonB-dependent receptor plug domain-containing protein [Bacteroidales bacterium]
MMIPFGASAQQVQVRGTVTGSDDGEPIMGGSVMVKGTTIGVATGLDGTYSISVDRNATLVFNSVGYVTEEVAVNGRSTINVVLAVDRELLDDVLVVGYAVGNKRSVSGAVERVTADQMNQGLITSPIEALQGKVPGLVITQAGGSVLGTPTVRVRGTSSLSGGSDPLVIIDGIFADMATFQSLPVSDIKEISLLKDASETAQYGSRGSAGVIVVSTNKGEEGKTSVEYSGQFGISMAYKNIDVLTGDAWRETSKK